MGSSLLEIPSQLVERLGFDGRHPLVPHGLFGTLTDIWELRRHYDSERPRGQRPEKSRVAYEEYAELVQPGVGDDVDDHAVAGGMNADRQAVWKVPHGADVTLSDGDVGQVCGLDPNQRRQVRCLLLGGGQP